MYIDLLTKLESTYIIDLQAHIEGHQHIENSENDPEDFVVVDLKADVGNRIIHVKGEQEYRWTERQTHRQKNRWRDRQTD